MITVELDNVSKRYTNHWIIRDASHLFDKPIVYGISGSNGSGKSTLIQLISGFLSPSVGKIHYHMASKEVDRNDIFRHLAITAPYIDIEEIFTFRRFLTHYNRFKPLQQGTSIDQVIDLSGLASYADQEIENYSSGMKQRVKLITALSTAAPLVIMDEPTSYLDEEAKAWLYDRIRNRPSGQLIIMASNEKNDLDQCDEVISIDYFQNRRKS